MMGLVSPTVETVAPTAFAAVQVLLQVQVMSAIPAQEKYRGLADALRRIPQREGVLVSIPYALPMHDDQRQPGAAGLCLN